MSNEDGIGLAEFTKWVEGLWGRHGETPMKLRAMYLGCKKRAPNLSTTELCNILTHHADAKPNALRPDWDAIFRAVSARSSGEEGTATDAWGQMLAQERRVRRKLNLPDVSDADVWAWRLDSFSYPITHNTVTHERHADEGGRRAREASVMRANESQYWVCWHRENGRELPPFLVADTRSIPDVVAECRRTGEPVPPHIVAYLTRIGHADLLDGAETTPQDGGETPERPLESTGPLELV